MDFQYRTRLNNFFTANSAVFETFFKDMCLPNNAIELHKKFFILSEFIEDGNIFESSVIENELKKVEGFTDMCNSIISLCNNFL